MTTEDARATRRVFVMGSAIALGAISVVLVLSAILRGATLPTVIALVVGWAVVVLVAIVARGEFREARAAGMSMPRATIRAVGRTTAAFILGR